MKKAICIILAVAGAAAIYFTRRTHPRGRREMKAVGSIHMVGKATFANGDIIPYSGLCRLFGTLSVGAAAGKAGNGGAVICWKN